MSKPPPTVAIACGGTGGHFYPGLAIARVIRKRGGDALLFIAGQNQARQLEIARADGFTAIAADAVRLPRSGGDAVRFATEFPSAINAHRKELKRYQVTAALGMGSFASAPLCIAARSRRIPLFLHEGNTTAGKANRKFAALAKTLMTSFPLTNPPKAGVNIKLVGMPLRQELVDAAANECNPDQQATIRAELGLDPTLPTLLVFGGSQGASSINQSVLTTLCGRTQEANAKLQIILLTGAEDNGSIKGDLEVAGVRALIEASTQDMARRYLAADAVICRAGASSIAELCLFGRAPLLVPLPNAADNHQQTNADWAVATGGAQCCPQDTFNAAFVNSWVSDFVKKPEVWRQRGQTLLQHARPSAAIDAAEMILNG